MGTKNRWIKSTLDEANKCDVKMPWERGAKRQAMIARRLEQSEHSAKVTLPPLPAFMTSAVASA